MIITVASFKGGVGKSTSSLHLAQYLATRRGAGKVVLADGDPNHSALSWGQRSQTCKFKIVDANSDLGEPNHLVIDTPARTEPDDLMVLVDGSDLLILPTNITPFSLEATIETLGNLPKVPKDRYRVLLTMVPPRGIARENQAREALKAVGIPVFNARIQSRIVYADAELEGATVDRMRGDGAKAAWEDYKKLGQEIMKGWN
jgi:chromosome partitioning protein